jgi:hypothetical protein
VEHFKLSFQVTGVCLAIALVWGGMTGDGVIVGALSAVFIAIILGVMEISLSFDNAIVNAAVLKNMEEKWQRYFLTWGILVAVFGMRLIFPLAIVAVATKMGMWDVAAMALAHPQDYAKHLTDSHVLISAFGGTFLMMVFLDFILDEGKDLHWIKIIEEKLVLLGKLESIEITVTMISLLIAQSYLDSPEAKASAMTAGVVGIVLYVMVNSLSALFENEEEGEVVTKGVQKAGIMSFIYLEILDASFSFDGVIGAFAITKDVVIIMLGLGIGAMFVRSLTVFLVKQGTLDLYIFLEHGAHYAIGALAVIMLCSMSIHISEVITGLIGAAFIGLSFYSSLRHNKLNLPHSL